MLQKTPLSARIYANFFVQRHGIAEALNIAVHTRFFPDHDAPQRDRDFWLCVVDEIKKMERKPLKEA